MMNTPFRKRLTNDCRQKFCDWYLSPLGSLLSDLESEYLRRKISVSYKHRVLQIGSLGWEDRFVDSGFLENYCIVDQQSRDNVKTALIKAESDQLPVASESIDTVILPHTIEFEANQHGVLREAERVLKPEGRLIILWFNPWSVHRLYHYFHGKFGLPPWSGRFLSRRRMEDWLTLLNFEMALTTEFQLKSSNSVLAKIEDPISGIMPIGYGIKAIKRRYTLIPLEPVSIMRPKLAVFDAVEGRWRTYG